MSRSLSLGALPLAVLLSTALATTAGAQAAAAKPADGSAKLVGEWAGPYSTDGPSGTMTLMVKQEAAIWKTVADLGADAPPAGAVSDVKAEGNVITWHQVFGEYDVVFKATLGEDGKLTGTMEAAQAGNYVGGGSFTLTRKT